ncbi:MAG: hypothetical protein V3S54_09340 [Woeseiaceae bacterium]
MTIGDIWRAATTVRTFNDVTPGEEKFSEWVVVTHYKTTEGTESDDDAALAIGDHQVAILSSPMELFAGNTRIVNLKQQNETSSFVLDQVVNFPFGIAEKRPLPPQVALGVFGRGSSIGRRAMKYYSSLNEDLLGLNGQLIFGVDTEVIRQIAFAEVFGFVDGIYRAGVFGATETPDFVEVTKTSLSPSWRTQRRRVLSFTQ